MTKQISGNRVALIVGVLCAFVLGAWGCDNGDDEKLGVPGKHPRPRPDQVATVGAEVCTYCHAVAVDHWKQGAHANLEAIDHATYAPLALGLDSDGFPYYGYLSDPSCAACHDPLGDGRNLLPGVTGNVDRPVVGCESCHGGGAEHFGTGDLPYPKPAAEQCGQCHNSSFPDDHLTYHPNGADIYEEYVLSAHSRSLGEHQLDDTTGQVRARCARCHTDEGFRKYQRQVPGTTGRLDFRAWFTGVPDLLLAESSSVTCRTCHSAHTASKDQLEAIDGENIAGVDLSPQYNTCTQCHQLSGLDGDYMAGSTVGPYHASDPEEHVSDTHAGVPGDTRLNSGAGAVPVLFVNKKDSGSCAACHNPHRADPEINRQWRQSGHGDLLGDPWVHYDWKHNGRFSCQRCHTSTGAKNFLNALAAGNPALYTSAANQAEFALYAGFEASPAARIDGNDQMETLYCWGCHSDYKGGLRDPGRYTAEWLDMDGITFYQFPDLSGSNVCITCHSSRASGGSVTKAKNDGVTDFNNLSFINSHYLGAGMTMFRGAYEFDGRSYNNVPYYQHDRLGLTGTGLGATVDAAAGVNGPCVACHMTANPEKHLFSPVNREGDTITGIASTLCASCHAGIHELTLAEFEENSEHYQDSMTALKYFLDQRGFFWRPESPYFFKVADGSTTPQKDWSTDGSVRGLGDGPNNIGAAFNLNFLKHDPGGFTHNRVYAQRLIYDSIDWLDDNLMNDSVNASLLALDPLVYAWRDHAIAYVLNSTGGRP